MPTYTYRCKDCQHEYEAFQSIKEEAHKICPQCKGAVIRLIGAGAGIVFKGSGFYVTDYRKGSETKTEGTEGKKTEKGANGKTESSKNSDSKGDSSTKKAASSPSSSSKTDQPSS